MHEASCHDENCFVTLTYDDAHLPASGSLDRNAFRLFMDRMRKRYGYSKIRYFHCGEYGERFGRPHYHALLFGHDFADKARISSSTDYPLWCSMELAGLWPAGMAVLGAVTFESAAYCARYCIKKITGAQAKAHYNGREPEYATMSRRPGIGKMWLERYGSDVFPADRVVVRGREGRPPRYYLKDLEDRYPLTALLVKHARSRELNLEDQSLERLEVREAVASAKYSLSPGREVV